MGLLNQLDRRTQLLSRLLRDITEKRPVAFLRGSLWRCLIAFLFLVEVVTGIVLMAFYSPATPTAWGSVWYVQTQAPSGWLIRGIHHFSSDALLIFLVLYGIALLVRRAYRAPAELLWWTVLLAIGVALALSLSGELLPWDQAGYWGTTVRANILARTPLIGPTLKEWLLGGPVMGNLTLTRFYALHAAVLPILLGFLLLVHRRAWRVQIGSGLAGAGRRRRAYFPWPMIRDTLACAILLGVLFALVGHAHVRWGWQLLDAPADPSAANYPARPEWHTIFLFQWLKYFQGSIAEVVGAVLIPGAVVVLLFLVPYLHRWLSRRASHFAVLTSTAILLFLAVSLSAISLNGDRNPPDDVVDAIRAKQQSGAALTLADERILRAREFNTLRAQAARIRDRAFKLAEIEGIPPEGPASLLGRDPLTRGPQLFAANCALCHRFAGHDGQGNVPMEPATSSDLAGYASRGWIRRLLNNPMDERHFGRMKKPDSLPAHTKMAEWTSEQRDAATDDQSKRVLDQNFDAAAAYLEDESRHPGRLAEVPIEELAPQDPAHPAALGSDEALIRHGRWFFMTACNECHGYAGERSGTFRAPEMRGYGSVEWIEHMIAEPDADDRYRKQGREPAQMPRFMDRLSESDRTILAQWARGSPDQMQP